jgi:PAS domain S-box-containing protein
MMGAAAWWSFFYCWEILTPGLQGKLFWVQVEYFGIVAIPLAWFLFAWNYTDAVRRLDRRILTALCVMPLLTIILVATSGAHGVVWSRVYLDATGKFPVISLAHGPWFWVNTVYSYVLILAGSVLLLRTAHRYPTVYRGQAGLLVVAVLIPWICNGLTAFVIRDWIDITPIGLLLMGIVLFIALTRWRLFSLPPVLGPLARMRFFETLVDGILAVDIDGTVVSANPAAAAIFGGEKGGGLVGKPISALLGEQASGLSPADAAGDRRQEISLGEGDERRDFDVTSSPLNLRADEVGSLLVLRDITERKRTETALRTSEERFRAIFEQGSVGIAVFDADRHFVRVNPALCSMLGYEEQELVGMTVDVITAPAYVDRTRGESGDLIAGESPLLQMDKQYLRKDGTLVWGHVAAGLLRGGDGSPLGTVAMVRDISEQKRAAEALKTTQAQLEAAMELASLVDWEFDAINEVFTFNDRLYAFYGTTAEAQGGYLMSAADYTAKFVYPDDQELVPAEVAKVLQGDDPDQIAYLEHRIVRGDGEVRYIAVRYGIVLDEEGRPIGTHGSNQVITERKRTELALDHAEEQLRQSQKMEAVGQLAGGIAHDFNNLLTAIIGNSDLALGAMPADDPNREFVEGIKEVGERAAVLTKQILAFSRRQMLQPEVVDLNDVVRRLQPLLVRTLGEKIQVETLMAPDLMPAEVDPHQMEQVLMNLAVNARDAMPDGGRLLIVTANAELGPEDATPESELEPGSYVMLAVSDTGLGMDADTRSRVFEPFFTTKALGKGTGLGLSTVFGIVRQSGGGVTVDSQPGEGSTFRVYLPVHVGAEAADTVAEPPAGKTITGTGTILVVEDEPAVRQLVVRILRRAGYTTLEAGSAAEVEALIEARGPLLDLLLTDVGLPGGGGRVVAVLARRRQPELPVIFMSGYTQESDVFDGSGAEDTEFLSKPFTADELLALVQAVMDRGQGS